MDSQPAQNYVFHCASEATYCQISTSSRTLYVNIMQTSRVRASLLLASFAASFLSPANSKLNAQSTAQVQSNRVTRLADEGEGAPVAIPGHIPAWATPQNDAGAIPAAQTVQLIVGVSRSPELEAAFKQLLDDQQNRTSPRFHQWLTPQQVGEQFGPTQHDLDALTSWLTSQGFKVDSITPSRTFIQVSAPASTVQAALHTSLHSFNNPAGILQAPTSDPSIPASLSPIVSFISGLASVPYHTHSTHLVDSPRSSAPDGTSASLRPDYTYQGSAATYHFLVPGDFATIYNIKPAYNAGINGTGQKVTIVGGSQLLPADIAAYQQLTGLAAYTPNTVVPTGTGFADPGLSTSDQTEGMLDFERVNGTAPGATINFLISKNWLNGTTTENLLLYAINTLNDPIMSLSFGACENLQSPSYVRYEDSIYSQAASQGMSVFVSSGDNGSAGCNGLTTASTAYPSINDICATGYVTCVGGTQFADTVFPGNYWSSLNLTNNSSAVTYIPEGAWNEYANSSGVFQAASGGGGVSAIIAKPTWQTGFGVPADGFRDVPDISFSSSGHNGYILCQSAYHNDGCVPNSAGSYSFAIVGGTSAAAPSMAGIAALLNQKLGGRQGNLNPTLYRLALTNPAAFHDATPTSSGVTNCAVAIPSLCNNSVPTTTTSNLPVVAGYGLTPGYDLATGLGSLDVAAFINAASATTATTTALTASATTATITQSVTFTARVSGTSPTGTVQFYANGLALGSPVSLIAGVAATPALTFQPAGTYSITAAYSGDNTFGGSVSVALTLNITNPVAVSSSNLLKANASSPLTVNQAVIFTSTITGAGGTPTGNVQFFIDGTALGTAPTVAGIASLNVLAILPGTHTITSIYSGDNAYLASNSNPVVLTVTSPGLTLTSSVPSLTVTAGASTGNSATVTYTSTGGFAGAVTVGCSIAYSGGLAPVAPTCTASPSTLTLTSGGAGTATFTISTLASHASLERPAFFPGARSGAFGGAALATLLLVLLPTRRRVFRNWRALSVLALLSAAIFTTAGCGSGGSTAASTTVIGTTKGVYSVSISGTGGSVSSSISVPLTIQ